MKYLLYPTLFLFLFLSGCEKKASPVAPAELFVLSADTTSANITIGDDAAAFIKAYRNNTIQVAFNDVTSTYVVMSIKKIPYTENISTMIANFFIDGKPVSEMDLCTTNSIQPTELFPLLSSSAYLQEHEVVYRYLRFEWEDGKIVDIESEELNYNETFETPKLD